MSAARGTEPLVLTAVTGLPLYVIPLGYATPPLTLNHRHHPRVKARLTREIRTRVALRCLQLQAKPAPHLHVSLHYVPAARRDRDADNLVATLKPAIDGLTAKGRDRGWPGAQLVPDDTPRYVSWVPPRIHEPDGTVPRLWLEVQALNSAPPPAGSSYGYGAATPPVSEGPADA